VRDGYIRRKDEFKFKCYVDGKDCDDVCKSEGGSAGYCTALGFLCYCAGLPDDKAWKPTSS
uniref:Putative insect toxin Acra6 n=1 Tax=Androctonus crassicauda TaxID=122909 RepID=SCX6_ANDCR